MARVIKSRVEERGRIRVLTAAGTRIKIDDRAEVQRQRAVRMNWQLEAFMYRNSIGELRYAVNYLANCAARMRMYVAALPLDGESDMPIEISKIDDVPQQILDLCANAMRDLGNGRVAMSNHMHSLSTNISLAGEAFLLGQEDPLTHRQTWSIRSISEIVVANDELMLREGPIDSVGQLGLVKLDPMLTTVSRMWQPDPEWRLLADSAMKSILNECESLLILRRMIRAVGRSRLAGRGLLLFPEEVSIQVNDDDNLDPEADPTMDALAEAMMTPIVSEGDASAVVPIVVRGPSEHLKEIRLVELGGTFDAESRANREEIVGVIASGLDLPKEVITGIADLNHWSAWQVDDNTFRHHVEPHIITLADCLTSGFLRPYVSSSDVDPVLLAQWAPRLMFWYDPTELVTHPDRMGNATALHSSLAISDAAYREAGGFTEEDAPNELEIETRMIRTMRNWPSNVVMALLHALDPTLEVPAMTGPPALPGIEAGAGGGAVAPDAPDAAATSSSTSGATGDDTDASSVLSDPYQSPSDASSVVPGPPATGDVVGSGFMADDLEALRRVLRYVEANSTSALVGSAEWRPSAKAQRLSRMLQKIDADLRARLQIACVDALTRHLEKVGGRMRNKVASNETLRKKIAPVDNTQVLSVLGRDIVEKAGLVAAGLEVSTWADLKDKYMSMVSDAQARALSTAVQLIGIDESIANKYAPSFAASADKGWSILQDSMNSLAVNLAYKAGSGLTSDEAIATFNPDSIIPTGVVRASLAVAGGTPLNDFGIVKTKDGADVPAIPMGFPVGGIGTGATINGILEANGAKTYSYEWEHGPSMRPFDPHLALDGVEFESFTDDALANNGDFPANQYFMPGDHNGCLCDVTPLWVSADEVQQAMDNAGVDPSTWPKSAFNTPTGVFNATSSVAPSKHAPIPQAVAQSQVTTPTFSKYTEESTADQIAKSLGYTNDAQYKLMNGGESAATTDHPEKWVLPQTPDEIAQAFGYENDADYKMMYGHSVVDANWVTPYAVSNDAVKKAAADLSTTLKQRGLIGAKSSTKLAGESTKLAGESAKIAGESTQIAGESSGKFSVSAMEKLSAKQLSAGTADKVMSVVKVSDARFSALDKYVGTSHSWMNAHLRDDTALNDASKETISRLKQAIEEQPRSTGDLLVQRVGRVPGDLKVGATFIDKGFFSAAMPGGTTSYGRGVRMFIKLPKGSQYLKVNHQFDLHNAHNGSHIENEAILPPGSKFRVAAINPDGSYVLTHIPKKAKS